MKTIHISIILFLIVIILAMTSCESEGKYCHSSISIVNNTSDTIISAIPIPDAESKCRLDGEIIEPKSSEKYFPYHHCIEDRLVNDSMYILIYIVDPKLYNDENIYYDADSIEIRNRVLKKFIVNLSDLRQNNFTLKYP